MGLVPGLSGGGAVGDTRVGRDSGCLGWGGRLLSYQRGAAATQLRWTVTCGPWVARSSNSSRKAGNPDFGDLSQYLNVGVLFFF